mgnify:FL=1
MRNSRNQLVGEWGEGVAASFLAGKGFEIIDRNFRTPFGEIDLIVQKEGLIVLVEVKTRTSKKFGMPENAITLLKKSHMRDSAEYYLGTLSCDPTEVRADVISILAKPDLSEYHLEWFENATA